MRSQSNLQQIYLFCVFILKMSANYQTLSEQYNPSLATLRMDASNSIGKQELESMPPSYAMNLKYQTDSTNFNQLQSSNAGLPMEDTYSVDAYKDMKQMKSMPYTLNLPKSSPPPSAALKAALKLKYDTNVTNFNELSMSQAGMPMEDTYNENVYNNIMKQVKSNEPFYNIFGISNGEQAAVFKENAAKLMSGPLGKQPQKEGWYYLPTALYESNQYVDVGKGPVWGPKNAIAGKKTSFTLKSSPTSSSDNTWVMVLVVVLVLVLIFYHCKK